MAESSQQHGLGVADAAILESMAVPMMALDSECRVLRFNRAAEQLTGYQLEQVRGRCCSDVLHPSSCDESCPVRRALSSSTTCRMGTIVLQRRDGAPQIVEMTASALMDPVGSAVGAVAILRDLDRSVGQMRVYGSRVFVSRTPAMWRVFDALPRLASSSAPVFIVGGRGSGRSALAETIHNLGRRCPAPPLTVVRCSSSRAGKTLCRAMDQSASASGTLVLEDVCTAPVALQRQLLAWFEEGGDALPFRLISTATGELAACLESGGFRRDLFHRLDVLHVALPALADRLADIPLLVEQFVEELNGQRGRTVAGLSPRALTVLLAHRYPGNVRQLRMIVEQAHARAAGRWITAEDLPELGKRPRRSRPALDRATIEGALQQCSGNMSQAARLLEVHRSTLWRRVRALKLKR